MSDLYVDPAGGATYTKIVDAYNASSAGDTIHLAKGVYREGDLWFKRPVHIVGGPGVEWSGADLFTDWSKGADGFWHTGFNKLRLSSVTTVQPNPADETNEARYLEALWVDGEEWRQVWSKADLTGKTFYVDDPSPISLVNATDNSKGYNSFEPYGASYVLPIDPTGHTVEAIQHVRLLTIAGKDADGATTPDGTTITGVEFKRAATYQQWGLTYPNAIGSLTGGSAVYFGVNGTVTDCGFTEFQAAPGLGVSGSSTNPKALTVTGCRFWANKGNAFGINYGHDSVVERCKFWDNNVGGFATAGTGSYSTVGYMKFTHAQNVTFRFNELYGPTDQDYSLATVFQAGNELKGLWLDEGMYKCKVYGNYFYGFPIAYFDEVGDSNLFCHNIIEKCAQGIRLVGSANDRVWNNTVVKCSLPAYLREDARHGGYLNWSAGKGWYNPVQFAVDTGQTWDQTNIEFCNNVMADKITDGISSSSTNWSMFVKIAGVTDKDGTNRAWADTMMSHMDGNVYHRSLDTRPSETNVIQWAYDPANPTGDLYATISDWTAAGHVGTTMAGREASALVLDGDGRPLDELYRVDPGGPLANSGVALPEDVAALAGLSSGAVADRGALVNVKWQDSTRRKRIGDSHMSVRSQATAYAYLTSVDDLSAESQVGDVAVLFMGGSGVTTDPSWVPAGWTGSCVTNTGNNRCAMVATLKVTNPAQTHHVQWSDPNTKWAGKQYGALLVLRHADSATAGAIQTTAPSSALTPAVAGAIPLLLSFSWNTITLAASANAFPRRWPAENVVLHRATAADAPWAAIRAGFSTLNPKTSAGAAPQVWVQVDVVPEAVPAWDEAAASLWDGQSEAALTPGA